MGYFSSLINITGINLGQGNDTGSRGVTDAPSPQPIHTEDTTSVEPTVSQTGHASEAAEAAVTGKDMESAKLGERTVEVTGNKDRGIGAEEIDRVEILHGQKETGMDNNVEEKSGKKESPAIFEDKRKVDNTRHEKDKPIHSRDKDPVQKLKQQGENPSIHKELVGYKADGKNHDKSGTNISGEVTDAGFSQGHSHNQHIREETITYSSNKKGIGEPVDKSGAKREIVSKEVGKWLTEPQRIPEAGTIPRNTISEAKTAPLSPAPMEENREFSLSIGTIHVTVEEPQSHAVIQNNPLAQVPTEIRQNRRGVRETMSSRLGRHYIRLRS